MVGSIAYSYQVGGSLSPNANCYVTRAADREFYEATRAGELCYVFNSRQMGKSSLRVRVQRRLEAEGVTCAFIDLTGIGKADLTAEKWYAGLVQALVSSCHLGDRVSWRSWWKERSELSSPARRLREFIEEVLLVEIRSPIVIFIDEVDRVLSQDFSLDEFFALIRYFYNLRVDNADFCRLTFALLGVATPGALIRDKTQSPFNVGRAIALHGFTLEEATPLSEGLIGIVDDPTAIVAEVLSWTGGQPFLTQKLCQFIFQSSKDGTFSGVADIVSRKVVENWEARDEPQHFRTIRDRLLRDERKAGQLLGLYQQILREPDGIAAIETPEQWELRLSGLVVPREGRLQVYNPIYATIFSLDWVERQLSYFRPYSEAFLGWVGSGCTDESRLLRGNALAEALEWERGKKLNDLDRRFLFASKELDLEEINRGKLQKRVNQLKILSVVAVAAAVAALLFGLQSLRQQRRAAIAEIETLDLLTRARLAAPTTRENLETLIGSLKAAKQFQNTAILAGTPEGKAIAAEIETNLKHTVYDTLERNRFYHDNTVLAVAFSPDGKEIASASADGTVQIRTVAGELQNTLVHGADVTDVVFGPDGETIATASKDRTVKLWNRRGLLKTTLAVSGESFVKIRFSPDGRRLAAACDRYTIRIWRTDDGTLEQTIDGYNGQPAPRKTDFRDIAFSPDGRWLVGASTDTTLKVWNAGNGRLARTLPGHRDWVYSIDFSPDGRYLVSSGGGSDKTLKLWRTEDWRCIKNIVKAHNSALYAVFSPKGNSLGESAPSVIASVGADQILKIWDLDSILATPEKDLTLFAYPGLALKTIGGIRSESNGLHFSPDGTTIALAGVDRTVTLWKLDPILLKSVKASEFKILKIVISPDGDSLAESAPSVIATAGADNTVRIWTADGKLLRTFPRHHDWIFGLSFSPDGKFIASASEDNTIDIRQVETGNPAFVLRHENKAYDVSFSPDGRFLASVGDDKKLHLRNARTGELIRTWTVENNVYYAWSIAFSPDSRYLAANTREGIRVWEVESGQLWRTLKNEGDKEATVIRISFGPDGRTLAASSIDNTVKLWNIGDGKIEATLRGHENWVMDARFSADGKLIATAGGNDKTIRFWTRDGRLLRTLEGHASAVNSVAFTPGDRYLLSADDDGIFKFWDLRHLEKKSLHLDELMNRGCAILRDYLRNSPTAATAERSLCD